MSFADYQNLPVSKKIVLFEIDLPVAGENANDVLLNYEAGIWFNTLHPGVVYVTGSDGQIGYYDNQSVDDLKDVSSVKVGIVDYLKVSSMAELRQQKEAFYYDTTTTKLYIHFTGTEQPLDKRIVIGVFFGFCDQVSSTGCYYNNSYYEPRIKSIPSINKQKDRMFFGLMQYNGGSVTLDNSDGYFDNFSQLNAFRQKAVIRFGFDGMAYSDFRTVFTGYVEKYSYDFGKFTINLQDMRKLLSRKIPTNYLNKTNYPYLADDNVDKVKPIAYGVVRGAPCICLNSEQSGASVYTFLLADTTYNAVSSIQAVYIDGKATALYTPDLAAGTFTLASAYVSDNLGDVTADFTVSPSNSLYVARDIISNYAGVSFIPTNYNIREWNRAQAVARSIGLYIKESIEISKALEYCCVASDAVFIVQDDGKYTARIYSATRTASRTIYSDEWIGDPSVSIDESEFLSSVIIKYSKNWNANTFRSFRNDDYETEVSTQYKSYQEETIETLLTNETDAAAKSESIMELSKTITEQVKRKLKTQHIDLEVMDIAIAAPKTRQGMTEQWGYYEVMGINKNLSKAEIELSLRFISSYTPPAETDYIQGYLWHNRLIGEKLFSVTEQ